MKRLIQTTTLILAPLFIGGSALHGQTYDEHYNVVHNTTTIPNDNFFMHGTFQKIIRFDQITMDDDTNQSEENFDIALKTIKRYIDDGKKIKVTVIGHTQRVTDDPNEVSIDSKTYANRIQNWFRDSFTTEDSNETSEKYAQKIYDRFVDNNISKDLLVLEYRGAKDPAYTQATQEGEDLNKRVMVSMYVLEEKKAQPQPKVVPQPIVPVVENTPLDSDEDGVFDSFDQCPNTPKNMIVDKDGCPLKADLHVNFKTDSARILPESYPEVKSFAQFLKDHPKYNARIVGHTDYIGDAQYNLKLSKRRAKAVKDALVHYGVLADRLTTDGRGEFEPVASNKTAHGRYLNRRTEVELSY